MKSASVVPTTILGRQLLLVILCVSSVLAAMITAGQLWAEYRRDIQHLLTNVSQAQQASRQAIAESIWHYDVRLAEKLVNGILQLEHVEYVAVRLADGTLFCSAGNLPTGNNLIHETTPLQYCTGFDGIEDLGQLEVVASKEAIISQTWESAITIFLAQMIKTFIVSLVVLYVVSRLVTRHLQRIQHYFKGFHLDNLSQLLKLEPDALFTHETNELRELEKHINAMRNSLKEELDKRLQAEEDRELLIAELEAKNTELEQFVYTVSHDLKSPMITVRGFLDLLKKDIAAGDHDQVEADIQRIRMATEQMVDRLNGLLELSRIGRIVNDPEPVDSKAIIESYLSMNQEILEMRQVQVSVSEPLPVFYCDGERLKQVIQNILDNAIKYTSSMPHPEIRIEGSRDEQSLQGKLLVEDNGPGIPREFREKVFGLFERLSSDDEGSGIGLAVVRRIIEVQGGRVWIEDSRWSTGIRLCFTLPLASIETANRESREKVVS